MRGFLAAFDQATGKEVWRFYVLDRTDGTFLSGTKLVKNITWASGLTPQGRPIKVPNMGPSLEGQRVCPSLEGASNIGEAFQFYWLAGKLHSGDVLVRQQAVRRRGRRLGDHGVRTPGLR